MTPFERVLAHPRSLAARYYLLDEWQAKGVPQAALLENQLAERLYTGSNKRSKGCWNHKRTILKLIKDHGREWAGRVAELVDKYEYNRGLVSRIELPGERFLAVLPELFTLAPIQHVQLTKPLGSIEAIAKSPLLLRLSSLCIEGFTDDVGDRGAIALASSPFVANLTKLVLCNNGIGREGVEALAASPFLIGVKYLALDGNPVNPSPYVVPEGDAMMIWNYLPCRPPLAAELEEEFGPRPWLELPTGYLETWPEVEDELALIHDYASDRTLDQLEELAREVDRLAVETDEESEAKAFAKRQRLLIELDVAHLLTGQPEIGKRLAKHPALRRYHYACVAMANYHVSDARKRFVGKKVPNKLTDGWVSLDWFRRSNGYVPDGVPEHDWTALCERNLIDPMPTGTGTRFVKLEGELHVLSYRIEEGPEPKLWRAEPAGGGKKRDIKEFAQFILKEMDKPKSAERQAYEEQKEAEDRIAIERMYADTGQIKPEEIMAKALRILAEKIEQLNPSGEFEPIEVSIRIKRRDGALRFAAMPPKYGKNQVELSIQTESGQSTSTQVLELGSTTELIAFLRKPETIAQALATVDDCMLSLERHGFA